MFWYNKILHYLLLHLLLHPFNSRFSRTTWVSQHQKGKPFWVLLEQEMTGWQWHQLDHMQIICTSIQTDNHASTSPLSFYRPDAFPVAQPTASKHWRQHLSYGVMKTLMWHKCGSRAAFFITVSGSLLCHRLLWQCGKAFKCKALVHSANINMTNQNTIAPTNHSYISAYTEICICYKQGMNDTATWLTPRYR